MITHAAIDSFLSCGLIVVDAQGLVISWSAGAEHLLGYARAQIEGQPLRMLLGAEVAVGADATGSACRDQLFRHRDGGWRTLSARVSAVTCAAMRGAVALLVSASAVQLPTEVAGGTTGATGMLPATAATVPTEAALAALRSRLLDLQSAGDGWGGTGAGHSRGRDDAWRGGAPDELIAFTPAGTFPTL